MFDTLVGSNIVAERRFEGKKKEQRLDRIKRKYVKRILGLDIETLNYILTKETKMKKLNLKIRKKSH